MQLYAEIIEKFKKIKNLEEIQALLSWDQEVYMPSRGIDSRVEKIGLITELIQQNYLDDRFYDQVCQWLEHEKDGEKKQLKIKEIQFLKYNLDRKRKIPTRLAVALSRKTALANNEWAKAKQDNQDEKYLNLLEEIVKLKLEYAQIMGYENNPYDALLDDFDPGMKYQDIEPVFFSLQNNLNIIQQKIKQSKVKLNKSFLLLDYQPDLQRKFNEYILKEMQIDFNHFRMDYSEHPFTTTIGHKDVRVTTHIYANQLLNGLLSTIHEGGHAAYELGVVEQLGHSPAAEILSCAIHESQSRLYENMIGRSFAFWHNYFPLLKEHFPNQLKDVKSEQFFAAVNEVDFNPVRIFADEVTYNLHIVLRTEMENALINGQIRIRQIEEAWNEKSRSIIGYTPRTKNEGYLQDIHWSLGYFGYFPGYTYGTLISAQLFQKMEQDLGGLPLINHESFRKIKDWLSTHIYLPGNTLNSNDLVLKVTGQNVNADSFIDYIQSKYKAIYQFD